MPEKSDVVNNFVIVKIETMDHDNPERVLTSNIIVHDTIGKALDGFAPDPRTGASFKIEVISDSAIMMHNPNTPMTVTAFGVDLSTVPLEDLNQMSIDDTLNLHPRARNPLYRANITTVGELVRYKKSKLQSIPNMGTLSLSKIIDELEVHGLTLKDEGDD